ncbi:MAG TPA: hypothetical protein VHZ56_03540 [Devosia sp.]|jgi:hypothetical protein|nr:hypothetical protein [Devosia sp.]
MKKIALLAVMGLVAGGLAAPVLAATNEDSFQRADANKDGVVSWDEAIGVYPTLTQTLFQQADANGNKTLDEGEFSVLQGLSAGLSDTSKQSNG